jgi:signal transduction histidine kinase
VVSIRVREDEAAITIKDTGIGINEEMLPFIFERFMQVNKSLTRDVEGTGMGLSLVKAFIELHKGRIEVSSKEKIGTEFTVFFPIYVLDVENEDISKKLLPKYNDSNTRIELSDIYLKNIS